MDYEHRERRNNDFVSLRGVWAYYLDQATLELSYSQPVSSVQRDSGSVSVGINELLGLVRYYPKEEIEIKAGMVVNSFAGPRRNKAGGTGVGGVFGISFKVFGPLVINLVQGKIDSQNRYQVTSGIQFIFGSTLQEWKRSHLPGQGNVTTKRERRVGVRGFIGQ